MNQSPFTIGQVVLAKLDDAPWKEATIVGMDRCGNGWRYECEFPSGWVYGTCRVLALDTEPTWRTGPVRDVAGVATPTVLVGCIVG